MQSVFFNFLCVGRTHRKIIVIALPDGELRRTVSEREELVRSIELLVVFAVTALNFAVVAGCIRADESVPDTELGKGLLKECKTVGLRTVEPVEKLRTVVGLDTLNSIGEFLH